MGNELGRRTPALLRRSEVVVPTGPELSVGDGWTALPEPESLVNGNKIPT